ncbi:FAD-dependent oxidoreductase [Streptomyces litchfieldiae]|uniref:FAD-dependent monooxygenase n=1 Tax=Streptomyces litchfieldiae TaxID=3075543 RepID=A0ABU2MPL9_9ACTN|nr:FAD-dependent monooxygenase [Streptomyces sp. DSM 44938]MDT0343455.1 FAD-dependent monooxygenase [Streptomyces sp. DSM 44938]
MSGETHAVVLGGGLAGMLAATVLARHMAAVTVVERDVLPDGPRQRRGVPQARHAHLLWSGGARAIESLLPGTAERLLSLGAHRLAVPRDIVWFTPYGWQRRLPGSEFMFTCGRPLLDWVVRDQALNDKRVTVLAETEAVELTGTADRVTGVRVRGANGDTADLPADFVVDTAGRGSAMRRWLGALGLPPVEEDVVDSGIAYATRVFRAPPAAAGGFPMVNVAAAPGVGKPGRNGALAPIEDGRWLVTLAGTRGAEPTTEDDAFLDFARSLRHPVIAELLERAEPLGPVTGSRSTVNRRLRYDRMPHWPDGLLVLGDALAAFNPIYGHGMSSAALGALALDRELARGRLAPGTARAAQRAVAEAVDDPWMLATTQDICYPGVRVDSTDPRIASRPPEQQQYTDMVSTAALYDPVVSAAAMRVTALAAPVSLLQSTKVVMALRTAARHQPLTAPPFSVAERARLDGDAAAALTTT